MNTFEIKNGRFYINNIELKNVTSWNIKSDENTLIPTEVTISFITKVNTISY